MNYSLHKRLVDSSQRFCPWIPSLLYGVAFPILVIGLLVMTATREEELRLREVQMRPTMLVLEGIALLGLSSVVVADKRRRRKIKATERHKRTPASPVSGTSREATSIHEGTRDIIKEHVSILCRSDSARSDWRRPQAAMDQSETGASQMAKHHFELREEH